jgi:hypothetical protein
MPELTNTGKQTKIYFEFRLFHTKLCYLKNKFSKRFHFSLRDIIWSLCLCIRVCVCVCMCTFCPTKTRCLNFLRSPNRKLCNLTTGVVIPVTYNFPAIVCSVSVLPYILESNPHPNLIRTSFCRFLKRKKKLVRGSNPHISFNRFLPTRQTDWIILEVTNALTVIRLTHRVWSGHLRNCQRYKRTTADKRCGHLNASYMHVEAQNLRSDSRSGHFTQLCPYASHE